VIFDEDKAQLHDVVYIGSCHENPSPPVVPQTPQKVRAETAELRRPA
jgi:hypothetical protein